MTTLCLQCRQSVPEGAAYCPVCGAPQLRVQPMEDREPLHAVESHPANFHRGELNWPAALRAGATFAIPAGLLLAVPVGRDQIDIGPLATGPLSILWVACAVVLTLRLYRKRVSYGPALRPGLGGRIGLLVGLLVTAVSVAAGALWLVMQRYVLGRGAAIDQHLHAFAQLEIDMMRQSDPATVAQLGWLTRFWLSPEGAGSLLLLSLLLSTFFILLFGWLSGLFAVRYASGPRIPKA